MDEKFKLKEVRVELKTGVLLIAEVADAEGVKSLLEYIKTEGVWSEHKDVDNTEDSKKNVAADESDEPNGRIETQAGLPEGSLLAKKIVSFKNDTPQLLKPNSFTNVSSAVIVLLYAIEVGLKKKSISYESFKPIYEGQNIKSGTSLSLLVNNFKRDGYVDKNAYDSDRTLTLTARGAEKAIEDLKALTSGESA